MEMHKKKSKLETIELNFILFSEAGMIFTTVSDPAPCFDLCCDVRGLFHLFPLLCVCVSLAGGHVMLHWSDDRRLIRGGSEEMVDQQQNLAQLRARFWLALPLLHTGCGPCHVGLQC